MKLEEEEIAYETLLTHFEDPSLSAELQSELSKEQVQKIKN